MKPLAICMSLFLLLSIGCSRDGSPQPRETTLVVLSDQGGVDQKEERDMHTPPEDLGSAADLGSQQLPSPNFTAFPSGTVFVDIHMHCGGVSEDKCGISDAWREIEKAGGRSVALSVEHWAVTFGPEELEQIGGVDVLGAYPTEINELYERSFSNEEHIRFFSSLDCWHDTPLEEGWEDACKEDARDWLKRGAIGFKDHAGKQWDSNGEAGMFVSGWNKLAGNCESDKLSECAREPTMRYPLLEPSWREVVRYITEELEAPIITHATTWYAGDTECYDPISGETDYCAPVSRRHLLAFASWAKENLSEAARRRIIVAHAGFMIPGEKHLPRESDSEATRQQREETRDLMLSQVETLLESGLSIDTAVFMDFAAFTYQDDGQGACDMRGIFGKYGDQIFFGTDRKLDNQSCLVGSYNAWNHLLTGSTTAIGPTFDTCLGPVQMRGFALEETSIEGCPDVPQGTLQKILIDNFESLY